MEFSCSLNLNAKSHEILTQKTIAMFRLTLLSIFFCSLTGFAQNKPAVQGKTGTITGTVTDQKTSKLMPYATIILFKNDTLKIGQTKSDIKGMYSFKNLTFGTYKMMVSYTGYPNNTIKGIRVKSDIAVIVSVKLKSNETQLQELVTVTQDAKAADVIKTTRAEYSHPTGYISNNASYSYKKGKEKANFSYYNNGDVAHNTEEYSHIQDNNYKDALKDPLSTFSIDVDKASYSNMRRFINQNQLPPADAVRVEEMINYFSYTYAQPKNKDPFSITTEYTDCPWNAKHQLVHIGLQGKEIKMDKSIPNNLTFLIDVSGSMNSEHKLPLLKSGLRLLVEQMREQDNIAIVVYAGAAGLVLPPTSGSDKKTILETLDKLSAGGSTAGGAGIALAYKTAKDNFMKHGNNRVILATDGDFNVGVSSEGDLVRIIEKERESGVYLTVLGFGTGNYKDNKMEQLADKGNGNYAYIDNILEAKKVLVKEMGGTLLTIAKDVKLQIEFNPMKVKGYRLVGYENRLLNNEDFNDDKKDAGELGSGHTVTAIYEIIPAGSDETVGSIDALKYQKTPAITAPYSAEIMTIKFRYKEPKDTISKLLTHIVHDNKKEFANTSDNCRFACSVAEFGMLLRDSKFKGYSNFKELMELAKKSKGNDEDGYRAEFVKLVEKAELIMGQKVVSQH